MKKEYKFNTILREYNKVFVQKLKLPPGISNAIVVYTIELDSFYVVHHIPTSNNERCSLYDFVDTYFRGALVLSRFQKIIRSKKKEELKLTIKIWPPNKIRYAYLETNYFSGAGILGSSCMRYNVNQKSLNFYVKNNVRIVVLVDDKNNIHGRALLWDNINSTKRKTSFTYLDRVYTNSELLVSQFYDFAKENKWVRYPSTSPGERNEYYYKENIDIKDIFHFPYADTFRLLYYKDNIVMSAPNLLVEKTSTVYISLTQTGGSGYFPELDPNRVKEVFSLNYISKKDAIFVKRYDAWVLKTNIANINDNYYSTHDRNVIKTTIDGWILKKNSVFEVLTNEAIDVTKAVKSIKYNGHIHKLSIIYIENELYHKLDTDVICFRGKWYHISQCFVNYDREKRNMALSKQKFHFWIENEVFIPHPNDFVVRKPSFIPKNHATIAYNLVYNPTIDDIEYQAVYLTSRRGLIRLITGEFVIDTGANRKYLKRFNNKYYMKRDSKLPNKNQLVLFGNKK